MVVSHHGPLVFFFGFPRRHSCGAFALQLFVGSRCRRKRVRVVGLPDSYQSDCGSRFAPLLAVGFNSQNPLLQYRTIQTIPPETTRSSSFVVLLDLRVLVSRRRLFCIFNAASDVLRRMLVCCFVMPAQASSLLFSSLFCICWYAMVFFLHIPAGNTHAAFNVASLCCSHGTLLWYLRWDSVPAYQSYCCTGVYRPVCCQAYWLYLLLRLCLCRLPWERI
jgi:hypothetical protein